MIKYYAYYSFGGYKDMLLGNSDMKNVREVFYSPFYEQWRKSGEIGCTTGRMKEQMIELDQRQHITILTKENSSKIPSSALTFVTHSGFELVCCRLQSGQTTVAIKDLKGGVRDEYGRDTPFMLQLIGDDDRQMLLLCESVRRHWQDTTDLLSGLFVYNVELNALQCNLGILNDWVKEVLANPIAIGEIQNKCRLPIVVISDGVSVDYLAKELGFGKDDFGVVYNQAGRIVYESTRIRVDYADAYSTASSSSNFNIENIMTHIKAFLAVTPEDREDYEQIRQHISNIINRRIHY